MPTQYRKSDNPRVPTIPGGAAFGANAPQARPTNKHRPGAEGESAEVDFTKQVADGDDYKERRQRRGFEEQS